MASSSARDLARQILAHDFAGVEGSTAANAAAAGERAFLRVSNNLVRWVGSDGGQALFARALAIAQAENRALRVVPPPTRSALFLDALAASAEPHDAAMVIEGVVMILTSLIEMLRRLVGDELAMRLVAESAANPSTTGVRPPDAERKS